MFKVERLDKYKIAIDDGAYFSFDMDINDSLCELWIGKVTPIHKPQFYKFEVTYGIEYEIRETDWKIFKTKVEAFLFKGEDS